MRRIQVGRPFGRTGRTVRLSLQPVRPRFQRIFRQAIVRRKVVARVIGLKPRLFWSKPIFRKPIIRRVFYAYVPPPPMFKPPAPPQIPTKEQFDDKIAISRKRYGQNYNPVKIRGFSENRPELLCVTDFQPAYKRQAWNRQWSRTRKILPVGEKINTMFALATLRNNNISQLISTLRDDPETNAVIRSIESEYDTKIKSTVEDIRAVTSLFVNLERVKDALNLRKSQRKIMAKISQRTGDEAQVNTYQDILEMLGFERDNISEFSNTKILMQLMHDLNIILANYSPALLGIVNDDRKFDDDPFEIADNIFDPKREPMVMDDLRKQGGSGVAYHQTALTFFQNMASENVFNSTSNKIKFLMNMLSKEMIVSAGLGTGNASANLRSFGSEAKGNVFDNILGIPDATATNPAMGGSFALCTFMNIKSGDGVTVLPFESPLTEDAENEFVTGDEYFIDSLLQGQVKLDPRNLIVFLRQLELASNKAQSLIERTLLSLTGKSKARRAAGSDLFDEIGRIFLKFPTSTIDSNNSSSVYPNKWQVQLALLHLGSFNVELKMLLYQYTLLAGIYSNTTDIRTKGTYLAYNNITSTDVRKLDDLPALAGKYKGRGARNNYSLVDHVHAPAITDIIDQIIETVGGMLGEKGEGEIKLPAGVQSLFASDATVRSALTDLGNSQLPLQSINSFLNTLVSRANVGFTLQPRDNFFIQSGKRTRFSLISPAVLVAIVYEAFSAMSRISGVVFGSKNVLTWTTTTTPGGTIATAPTATTTTTTHTVTSFNLALNLVDATALRESLLPWTATSSMARIPKGLQEGAKNYRNAVARRKQFIESIREDLVDEENLVISILNFIFVYFQFIWTESKPLTDMTRLIRNHRPSHRGRGQALQSDIARIARLQARVDGDDIFAAINPAQIALSIREALEVQKTLRGKGRHHSAFRDQNLLSTASKNMLLAMLRESKFKRGAASNMKIVTVGIPSGMKASLKSLELQGQDTPGPERELDLVNINVFRRDLEFDDIIFKPMSFLFELSRFTDIKSSRNRRRYRLYGTSKSYCATGDVRTIDIQVDEDFKWGGRGTKSLSSSSYDTIHDIGEGPEYDLLTTAEKRQMFYNHITSYFLNVYLRLLTDMDFRESSFLINESVSQTKADGEDRQRFLKLLLSRVKNVAGRQVTLDELTAANPKMGPLLDKLNNSDSTSKGDEVISAQLGEISGKANIEIADSVLNFIKAFNPESFLTGADVTANRMLTPKLFERIFHLPVDLDEFEVDVEATNSTESGRKMLKSNDFKNVAMKRSNGALIMKPRPSSDGYHILSEIFINVESKFESNKEGEIVSSNPPEDGD